MRRAVVLAGDRDFKPAVESLVQLGVFVDVVADPRRVSRELTWAASAYKKLTFDQCYFWSSPPLRRKYPKPMIHSGEPNLVGATLLRSGLLCEQPLHIYQSKNGAMFTAVLAPSMDGLPRMAVYEDQDRLVLYLEIVYGPVKWS